MEIIELSKLENQCIRKENVFMYKDDYRNKRKCDVSGMYAKQRVYNPSTLDLVIKVLDELGYEYQKKRFEIYYDGLINLSIRCNDVNIFEGDFYDVESYYQKGFHNFKKMLLNGIEII